MWITFDGISGILWPHSVVRFLSFFFVFVLSLTHLASRTNQKTVFGFVPLRLGRVHLWGIQCALSARSTEWANGEDKAGIRMHNKFKNFRYLPLVSFQEKKCYVEQEKWPIIVSRFHCFMTALSMENMYGFAVFSGKFHKKICHWLWNSSMDHHHHHLGFSIECVQCIYSVDDKRYRRKDKIS